MTLPEVANDEVSQGFGAKCFARRQPRVLASATAEKLRAGPVPLWEIRVEGGWSFDLDGPDWPTYRRTFTIDAVSDTLAAQDGIRQFVAEVENMGDPEAA